MIEPPTEPSNHNEADEDKLPSFNAIAAICVVCFFGLYGGLYLANLKRPSTLSELGDSFGPINALVSTLAFAGIVYTLILQQKAYRLQKKDLKATMGEIRKTNAEHKIRRTLEQLQIFISSRRLDFPILPLVDHYIDSPRHQIGEESDPMYHRTYFGGEIILKKLRSLLDTGILNFEDYQDRDERFYVSTEKQRREVLILNVGLISRLVNECHTFFEVLRDIIDKSFSAIETEGIEQVVFFTGRVHAREYLGTASLVLDLAQETLRDCKEIPELNRNTSVLARYDERYAALAKETAKLLKTLRYFNLIIKDT